MDKQRWRIVHEPWRGQFSYFTEYFDTRFERFCTSACFATQGQAERYIERLLESDHGESTIVKEYGE